MNLIKNRG